jgi:hypothetical protein
MIRTTCLIFCVLPGVYARSADAQTVSLSLGLYTFTASETSPNTCYSNFNRGFIWYPGASQTGLEIYFVSNALPGSAANASEYYYVITGFPSVPSGGISGWAPGSVTETAFMSNVAAMPVTGPITFGTLANATPATHLYTITLQLTLHCSTMSTEVLTLVGR